MTDQAGTAEQALRPGEIRLGATGLRWAALAGAAGLLAWVGSLVLALATADGFERFLRSYLVAFMFFLGLALGSLFFVLLDHLTRAGWSVVLRRITEVTALGVIPLALLVLVIVLGRHELYTWTDAGAPAEDALLAHKRPYLNTPFFLLRIAFYFAVWIALAVYYQWGSLRQERARDDELTIQMERVAAPGMIFLAMTLTFAAFDFIMTLYPEWYSTIFGVYYFAGSVLATFSMVTVLVVLLRRAGRLGSAVGRGHFHDLGKLMFGFVVFWAYIAFSQYMLIWYAHIPEEALWFELRQEGVWAWLSLLLLFGHFVVPFLWLMSRHPKRRPGAMLAAALWLLLMHWYDLFWLVMPEAEPHGNPFHLQDLLTMLALGGVFFALVFARLARVRLVPLGDPRLDESIGLSSV